MGEVIRFPDEAGYARGGRYVDANTEPATVIILPVIRVERDIDGSNGLEPNTGNTPGPPPSPPPLALNLTGLEVPMRHPPLPVVIRALVMGRYFFIAAALSSLGACGTATGDFGEVRPTLASDFHDWTTPLAGPAKSALASTFELTDDERQLRDLSRPLVAPPYTSQQWYSILAEIGLVKPRHRVVTRATYATQLLASRYHSPSARYAQLMDDVRNDTTRLPEFFETAGRVLDMDARRQKSLDFVSALSPAERKSAEARIRENASIVALVREKLLQRESSYRYALERLVVAAPSPQAVQVEHAINRLQAQIARYQSPAPTWVREQNLATAR